MEKAAPASVCQGAAKAKAKGDTKTIQRSSHEPSHPTIQKATEEAEAQGKAANQAILERQEEMKQLREQYTEKEREAKILLKRPTNLQPRRFGAGGVAKACSRFGLRYGSTIGQEEREESPSR